MRGTGLGHGLVRRAVSSRRIVLKNVTSQELTVDVCECDELEEADGEEREAAGHHVHQVEQVEAALTHTTHVTMTL